MEGVNIMTPERGSSIEEVVLKRIMGCSLLGFAPYFLRGHFISNDQSEVVCSAIAFVVYLLARALI